MASFIWSGLMPRAANASAVDAASNRPGLLAKMLAIAALTMSGSSAMSAALLQTLTNSGLIAICSIRVSLALSAIACSRMAVFKLSVMLAVPVPAASASVTPVEMQVRSAANSSGDILSSKASNVAAASSGLFSMSPILASRSASMLASLAAFGSPDASATRNDAKPGLDSANAAAKAGSFMASASARASGSLSILEMVDSIAPLTASKLSTRDFNAVSPSQPIVVAAGSPVVSKVVAWSGVYAPVLHAALLNTSARGFVVTVFLIASLI